MFKLLNPVAYGITGDPVLGELYATTKEEVVEGATIEGLPAGRSLASGSYGYTLKGELFIYDEEEGFSFVGDEDSSAKSAPSNDTRSIGELKKGVSEEEEPEIIEEDTEEPEIEEKSER